MYPFVRACVCASKCVHLHVYECVCARVRAFVQVYMHLRACVCVSSAKCGRFDCVHMRECMRARVDVFFAGAQQC